MDPIVDLPKTSLPSVPRAKVTKLETAERLLMIEDLVNRRYDQNAIVAELRRVRNCPKSTALRLIAEVRQSRLRDFEATDESRRRRVDAANSLRARIRRIEEAPERKRKQLEKAHRLAWEQKEENAGKLYDPDQDVTLQLALTKLEPDWGMIHKYEALLADIEGTKQAQEVNVNVGFANALNSIVATVSPEMAAQLINEARDTMRAADIARANPQLLATIDLDEDTSDDE